MKRSTALPYTPFNWPSAVMQTGPLRRSYAPRAAPGAQRAAPDVHSSTRRLSSAVQDLRNPIDHR